MPLIRPNLSDVTELAALEEGTYPGRIVEITFKESKGGNPMIVVKWAIMHEDKERSRTGYHVITGQGAFMFDQLLRASGFADIADAYKNDPANAPEFDTDRLIGCEANVNMTNDIYQGRKTDNISGYLPL